MVPGAPAAASALQKGAERLTRMVGIGMLSSLGDHKGGAWTWHTPPTLFTTMDYGSRG